MPILKDMERPNRRIDTVYFMEAGIASVVAVQADDTRIEVGLIGREGMSGSAVVLGGDQSPHSTYIQVAGAGLRMPAKELRKAMEASDLLRNLLLRFVQVFMVQTAHTAIANARSHIDQRLARWILMAHDRTGDTTLPLTHEFRRGCGRQAGRSNRGAAKSEAAEVDRYGTKQNPGPKSQGSPAAGREFLRHA